MNESAPERGAGSDDPHRDTGSVVGIARWEHLCGSRCVRTGSSYVDPIQFCPLSEGSCSISAPTGASRSQSEGDLDLPEAAGRRAEGRPSGKSERSERNDGGRSLSAGWREVAEQLHVEEGIGHE